MKPNNKHNSLIIKGARQNNLKALDLEIFHNSFTIITGVSGSGKSSLAFETLYAEGQRRYVESLSSYARQFLGRMPKPPLDSIQGLAPAIAIEQKVITRNPRSTVATSTEIYDYLKLLYARFGSVVDPISGQTVKKYSTDQIGKWIVTHLQDQSVTLMFPASSLLNVSNTQKTDITEKLIKAGFIRIYSTEQGFKRIDKDSQSIENIADCYVVVDRIAIEKEHSQEDEWFSRLLDSIEKALWEGQGKCAVMGSNNPMLIQLFSDQFEVNGQFFEEPNTHNLSFNSPAGACKTCEGLGEITDIDPNLVIPNPELSVYDDCVLPWKTETMREFKSAFIHQAVVDDFPIHRAYQDLTEEQKSYLWNVKKGNTGIRMFFEYLESKSYKIQYRVMLSRYRGRTACPDCRGTKLKKEAGYVKIGFKPHKPGSQTTFYSLHDLLLLSVTHALNLFSNQGIDGVDPNAAKRLWDEIVSRLSFLHHVGLGYLTLHRMSNTLSGGESQRIRLATSLGSPLTGSLYILDEPSIGLHPKDTAQLIGVLKELRDRGNTVIVVEHEEEMMQAADYLVDIGPGAGIHGGEVVFAGAYEDLKNAQNSLTAAYLLGKKRINLPKNPKVLKHYIHVTGARENNLQNVDVRFPLEALTVVTGVSGSGKTTLVKNIIYPALLQKIDRFSGQKMGKFKSVTGPVHLIKGIELIDQNPLGRSSRSNPVTYVKAWDAIRELLASQGLAKQRKYKSSFFSFNVEGGRCDHCNGDGHVVVEMQFMADLNLPCEYCKGKRFKDEVLEVTWKDKNVSDILNLTIEESLSFFEEHKSITDKLNTLHEVGLGYIKLGQPTGTLSGGEAQRVKIASYLAKGLTTEPILFIFDEPTTGLHFDDIEKLLRSMYALIECGHSVLVIEHNTDFIVNSDFVIDLGPGGGVEGGCVMGMGTPSEIANLEGSFTGSFIKNKLSAFKQA